MNNLVVASGVPRQILEHDQPARLYTLIADRHVVQPISFAGTAALQEAVVNILRKYADKFYRVRREQSDIKYMKYRLLDAKDANLMFNPPSAHEETSSYTVKSVVPSRRLFPTLRSSSRTSKHCTRRKAGNFRGFTSTAISISRCSLP